MLKLLVFSILTACAAHRAPAPKPVVVESKKSVFLNGAELTAQQRTLVEAVIGPLAPGRYYTMRNRYLGLEGMDASRDLEPMIEAYKASHGHDAAISLLVSDSCSMWLSGDHVSSNCEPKIICGNALE